MPFFRSLFAAVGTHWLVSELLRNLLFNSQWTVIITAAWLLIGYRRVFGKIPESASMRDAGRAVLMAWFWPFAPKMKQ
jgi:hypothetical protein